MAGRAQRARPATPRAPSIPPHRPENSHAGTARGLLRSTDAGTTWAAVDGAPLLQVVTWADAGTAVGVDPAGAVWTSTDAAGTWQQTADLGAAPHAVAAAAADGTVRVAVVTDAGLAESLDGGRTFAVVLEF